MCQRAPECHARGSRAPRKAVPISLVSDSTTPRAKRGPSTLCVPRNQAHMNGDGGTKAGTPKVAGGPTAKDGGLSWSPSSAPATPSGKGDGVPGLPFTQVGPCSSSVKPRTLAWLAISHELPASYYELHIELTRHGTVLCREWRLQGR